MRSILEVLKIETKSGDSAKTGKPYAISTAHCIVRNDDGSISAVGTMRIPKVFEDVAKPGVFTASFGLATPDYGADQGKIVAQITSLTPVPSPSFKRVAPAV